MRIGSRASIGAIVASCLATSAHAGFESTSSGNLDIGFTVTTGSDTGDQLSISSADTFGEFQGFDVGSGTQSGSSSVDTASGTDSFGNPVSDLNLADGVIGEFTSLSVNYKSVAEASAMATDPQSQGLGIFTQETIFSFTPFGADNSVFDITVDFDEFFFDAFNEAADNGFAGSGVTTTVTLSNDDGFEDSRKVSDAVGDFFGTSDGGSFEELYDLLQDGLPVSGSPIDNPIVFSGLASTTYDLTIITETEALATAVVPVPAGLPLMLSGLAGLAWFVRRRSAG